MPDQANKPTFLHHLAHRSHPLSHLRTRKLTRRRQLTPPTGRPHGDMTGVLHFSSLARTKHNLIFKAHMRWQVFIDTQGNVRVPHSLDLMLASCTATAPRSHHTHTHTHKSLWSFTCVDRVEPASHEDLRAHSPLLGHDIASFLVMFSSCSPFSDASSSSSPSS
jgi:hypothetical protein